MNTFKGLAKQNNSYCRFISNDNTIIVHSNNTVASSFLLNHWEDFLNWKNSAVQVSKHKHLTIRNVNDYHRKLVSLFTWTADLWKVNDQWDQRLNEHKCSRYFQQLFMCRFSNQWISSDLTKNVSYIQKKERTTTK